MEDYYREDNNCVLRLLPAFREAIVDGQPYKDWSPGMPLPDPSKDLGYIVTNMAGTFYGIKVNTLDLSLWDTSNVLTVNRMFSESDIENLDLSMLDFAKCKDITSLFLGCVNLKSLDISNNSFPDMVCFSYWFPEYIEVLDISGFKKVPVGKNRNNVFIPPYGIKHLKHLFVNNEALKAEIMRNCGLCDKQVHAINSDPG